MLKMSLQDQICNGDTRRRTRVTDIINELLILVAVGGTCYPYNRWSVRPKFSSGDRISKDEAWVDHPQDSPITW